VHLLIVCCCPCTLTGAVQSFGSGNISVVSPTAVLIAGPIRISVGVFNGSTGEPGEHGSAWTEQQPPLSTPPPGVATCPCMGPCVRQVPWQCWDMLCSAVTLVVLPPCGRVLLLCADLQLATPPQCTATPQLCVLSVRTPRLPQVRQTALLATSSQVTACVHSLWQRADAPDT
jgi:hypothetical protein